MVALASRLHRDTARRRPARQSLSHSVDFGCNKLGRPGSFASYHQRGIVGLRFVTWRIYASANKAVYR